MASPVPFRAPRLNPCVGCGKSSLTLYCEACAPSSSAPASAYGVPRHCGRRWNGQPYDSQRSVHNPGAHKDHADDLLAHSTMEAGAAG